MAAYRKSLVAALVFALWRIALGAAVAEESGTVAPARGGLNYSLGGKGLSALSYNGQSLLESEQKGALQPRSPKFPGEETVAAAKAPVVTLDPAAQTVSLNYPWGHVSSAYHQTGDRLVLALQFTNSSDKLIAALPVVLAELKFPTVPNGKTLDAGQFGFGFKGATRPIGQIPLVADPSVAVPVIQIDYGADAMSFCSDDLAIELQAMASTNPPTRTAHPFEVVFRDVPPGATKKATVSFRFGPAASAGVLADDLLKRYAERYPFQVKWKDRRPIGMIFLAGLGRSTPTNPRRWIMNDGKLDVLSEEGKANFREALLKLADQSIEVLKKNNAQGMITWDPEGQEFHEAVYYGDPRLTPVLAPEMEFKADGKTSLIDEYFRKFRDAGLRVGVCIRPQQITMTGRRPGQGAAENAHAAEILKAKMQYAQRWGCTLFYVDSTIKQNWEPLDAEVFREVAQAWPDVLIMPENESMRYFAYTAPLNAYIDHRITSTPLDVRALYQDAFSVLMAPDGDKPEDREALIAAVRRGDILLFRGWYADPGNARIKAIYDEASRGGE
jgi:hypothetical protein